MFIFNPIKKTESVNIEIKYFEKIFLSQNELLILMENIPCNSQDVKHVLKIMSFFHKKKLFREC